MLGKFIKSQRVRLGLSQKEIAERIGVSRPTYIHIENDKKDVTLSQLDKLSGLFGMSMDELINKKRKTSDTTLLVKDAARDTKKPSVRISVPQENLQKFKEVLLYVLEKIGARPNVGEAVVCKLLYFIDFDYYEKFEEQLMGATYIKNHYGPTPLSFQDIVKQMEKKDELVQVKGKYFQREQKKYLPCRDPDLSLLSGQEKELIDWEIERFKDFNAKQMRDYSHKDVPWLTSDDQKPINYESVFYRTPEFSVRDYENEV